MMASVAIDQVRFEALMGKALTDIGGAMAVLMAYMGDRLGLYRVLAEGGPLTAGELAERAGISATYVGFIERGDNVPTLTIVIQIASALRVRPSDLLRDF